MRAPDVAELIVAGERSVSSSTAARQLSLALALTVVTRGVLVGAGRATCCIHARRA